MLGSETGAWEMEWSEGFSSPPVVPGDSADFSRQSTREGAHLILGHWHPPWASHLSPDLFLHFQTEQL